MTINEKPWTRAREVYRALKYGKVTKAADFVKHLCSRENYAHTWQLTELVSETNFIDWPKDSRKDDYYISEEGMCELVFGSQQPSQGNSLVNSQGKRLQKTLLQCVVSSCLTAAYKQNEGGPPKLIEEKDAAIALLNDDLKNREHDVVVLQAQRDVYKDQLQKCQDIITHLKTRYVPHANDLGKDNIVMIIEKDTAPEEDEFYEYPYYIARIQRRFITTKKRWFKAQYSHHRFIIEEVKNANSIHAFNRFEEKEYIERFQCYFKLVDIPRDVFHALTTPAIQE